MSVNNNAIYDTRGRRLSHQDLMRSWLTINCAMGLSSVWWSLAGSGSSMLTIFVSEWLMASASMVGIVASLGQFSPAIQPFAAVLLQRIGHRKYFLLSLLVIYYLSAIALLLIPLLGRDAAILQIGVSVVVVVSALGPIAGQLGQPAMMSWIGDLVPESRRSSFFGQQQSFMIIAGSAAFYIVSLVIDKYGGTRNPWMFVANFGIAVTAGLTVLWLFTRVPDLPMAKVEINSVTDSLKLMVQPCRDKIFRKLLVAVGLLYFFLSLGGTLPVLYIRGSRIGDHAPGLGASLQYFAMITAVSSVVSMFSARFWGWFGDKVGAKLLLIVGAIGSMWWWVFFVTTPENYRIVVLGGMILFGLFAPAVAVGTFSCALNLSPRENRPAYTGVFMATLMTGAFGSILAGYLADKFTVTSYILPTGMPFCYMHLLTILGTVGLAIAVLGILAIPTPGTKTVREMVLMLTDLRFPMNVVRALILAHGRSKKWALWAIQGLKGRSSVIAVEELATRVNDADFRVRWAAVEILGTQKVAAATEALAGFALQTGLIADGSQVEHGELTRKLHEKYVYLVKTENLKETIHDSTVYERIDEQLWGSVAEMTKSSAAMDNAPPLAELLARAQSDGVRKEIACAIAETYVPGSKFYEVLTGETAIQGSRFSKLTKQIVHNLARVSDVGIREQMVEVVASLEEYYHDEEYDKLIAVCKSLSGPQNSANSEVTVVEPMRQVLKCLGYKVNDNSKKKCQIEALLAVFFTAYILEHHKDIETSGILEEASSVNKYL